jgi:S-adenosylmethionine:tRNA ribosyltransferase-isomerase
VRLLVTDRAAGTHVHDSFFNLSVYVRSGDVFVVNDSATMPAAVRATRQNGETIALHVATTIDPTLWTVEPRGLVAVGEVLSLPDGGVVTLITPVDPEFARLWYARFELPLPMHAYLAKVGEPIRYGYVHERFPLTDYQTIFARRNGSSEMPSAARPFSSRVVREVRRAGGQFVTVTLHCGVSSFEYPERPATERYTVSPEAANAINEARSDGRRIVAVGTTAVRALESSVYDERVVASSGWTDLVIDPDTKIRVVDALITGFHEPAATHMSMLRAFVDAKLLEEAYAIAAEEGYYHHEFGDIHLIA